jgi:hypothetical protein
MVRVGRDLKRIGYIGTAKPEQLIQVETYGLHPGSAQYLGYLLTKKLGYDPVHNTCEGRGCRGRR